MPSSRWTLTTMATLCAALALACAAPAHAVRITEFKLPVPNSVPLGIAPGPDGNVWFTEVAGSRIGRITPSGAITDWSTGSGISTNSRPWGIAPGPDGNLWFSEEVGRIGRITTAAVATEFSGGISPGAGPRGITGGPDGNVWFTEDGGNRVGRITPAGAVTEFSLGITPGSRPLSIAAGSDGNLWFTSPATNRIGRITPAGVVTEFTAGITPGSRVHDITAGPDGNLWFTEADGNRVARITPAGVVTEFSAGITAGSRPRGITAGPDGNLWFAQEQGNRVARITPDGVVTEYSAGISGDFGIAGITAGPTGDVWYTGASTNVIGRVNLDPTVSTGNASAVGESTARLAGAVTPFSSRTSYAFEFGRTTAYGSATSPQILEPGVSPVAVAADAGSLAPGRLYHYRLVATSVAGTSHGADRTFTTAGAPAGGGDGATTPPRDRTGPRMRIARRPVSFNRSGRARISLRCPLAEVLGCRGSVRVETVPRRRRPAQTLATARFRVGGGQTEVVTLRLSRRGRALARDVRRLRGRVVVVARDGAGNRKRTVVAATVRMGRR